MTGTLTKPIMTEEGPLHNPENNVHKCKQDIPSKRQNVQQSDLRKSGGQPDRAQQRFCKICQANNLTQNGISEEIYQIRHI